jgi:PA domain/Secretion system C-terminal sorting domain
MFKFKQIKLVCIFALAVLFAQVAKAQIGALTVSAPANIAADYPFIALSNGWGTPATGLCGELVLVKDSLGATLGCNPVFNNIAGKIAVIDRGTCGFVVKALNAQAAGAVGVVFFNSAAAAPAAMGDNGSGYLVTIPVALLSQANGVIVKAELNAGNTVTACMTLPNIDATVTVDMTGQTVSPLGVFVGYSVENGPVQAASMTSNGDGSYSATISAPATSNLSYLFINGVSTTGAETVPMACGVPDPTTGGNVRAVYLGTASGAAPKVCFGKCTLCASAVTFVVDMKLETVSPNGVHIAGNFQGWNPSSTAMTAAGNGIYTYTANIAPGDTVDYKFINGNAWGADENGITADCGVSNGLGGFNRRVIIANAATTSLAAVCFNSCTACPSFACEPNAIICDGFENYATGGLNAQSTNWDTWDGTGGDGIVGTNQASTGTKSLEIDFATAGQDVILLLGDSTTGNYRLQWKMFIPAGKKGYTNVQHTITPAHLWASDIYFNDGGVGVISVGNTATPTILGGFTFPYDTWFTVVQNFDLDHNATAVTVNGLYAGGWNFNISSTAGTLSNKLSAINFYPADATHKYFVDEVQFIKLAPGTASDYCFNATNINSIFGGPTGVTNSTSLFNNTGANVVGDPATGFECFGEPTGAAAMPSLEHTLYFTFTGDGNKYYIRTNQCGSTNYITDGDTQIAIYKGACGALVGAACNEDDATAVAGNYFAGLEFQTEAGVAYTMIIDGFSLNGAPASEGEFCIQATNKTVVVQPAVTFKVDMALQTVPAAGVFIAGEFNNYTGQAMTNLGGGIWSFSTPLTAGDTIEYKFQNGVGGWENNLPTSACGIGGFGNRYVIVPAADATLATVCFSLCTDCASGTNNVEFNNNISIAPNPTSGAALLKFNFNEMADLNVQITNSLGQQLSTFSERVQVGTKNIELGQYGKGVYFINLNDGKNRTTKRIIVE